MSMLTVSKSKLKAHMLRIFREIEQSGETLIVTDHSRPVLQIQPVQRKQPVEEVFADLQGQAIYHGNPDEPTVDEWDEV
jgi:antitoxin (DNA-binding transcriptional repressor) of toxin-antitoxin stability system